MWKFHNFSITQTLREINFEDSRSAKFAILTHLEALNFDFYEVLHFLKAEICQKIKCRTSGTAKMAAIECPHFSKLISRKI